MSSRRLPDGRSLVAGQQNDLRVLGIDPDGVIVVSAGRSLESGEVLAGIARPVVEVFATYTTSLLSGATRTPAKSEPLPVILDSLFTRVQVSPASSER